MHGVLFKGLKDFVVEFFDRETWYEVREEAGVGLEVYLPVNTYPDQELGALVMATAEVTDRRVSHVLEAFGWSVASNLLETYGDRLDPAWSAFDVVARAETDVHEVLRSHNENLDPPNLVCHREGTSRVVVEYRSDRGLCPLAKGLIRGIGDYYDTDLAVREPNCMYDGDEHCEFVVTDAD
jgi:predicted hydrocarbon binding protein